jgi:hypothetical protein
MASISAAGSSYLSPLQQLQKELQSEVNAGKISSADQDALTSALTDIDSSLHVCLSASDRLPGLRRRQTSVRGVSATYRALFQNGRMVAPCSHANPFWSWISKRSPSTELELLHDIVPSLAKRHCIVEAEGSKRRLPDQTHAYRTSDDFAVVILQAAGWAGC